MTSTEKLGLIFFVTGFVGYAASPYNWYMLLIAVAGVLMFMIGGRRE